MKLHPWILTLSLLGAALPPAAAEPTLALTRDGKALLPIALDSAISSPAEKTAARELKEYRDKIAGAEFSVVEVAAVAPDQPVNDAKYIGKEDVPGPGYHRYPGRKFALQDWCYL